MVLYNFKGITVVPSAKDFINFTLSKTQRKTPTEIHKHFQISRIRKFYMRKIKFTQQNFHDRAKLIISEFPKMQDMHPFHSGLLNTLYNQDHYKLALGQINHAVHLINQVAADYTKLMKFGDSLYRCKQLKKAALGRMVTIIRKQSSQLQYLEEVRQHLSRLPTIDPNTRTLILCGCPNAGKSSFINLLTNADVEVQPYAFTTKSLFVGHFNYEYLKWQVIDTPGVLDREVDEMNTIEMQAITALAHIKAAVVFFLDISEQCNVEIEAQLKIFEGLRNLFQDRPLVIACNKKDILSLQDLSEKFPEKRAMIKALEEEGITIIESSAVTKEGVMDIRTKACNKLLEQRVNQKLSTKKADTILNRINVSMPSNKKWEQERPAYIPDTLKKSKKDEIETDEMDNKSDKKLEKDLEEELGVDYTLDLNKFKQLENDEWNYDKVPVYIKGYNVADFYDANIEEKLKKLLEEEQERIDSGVYDTEPEKLTEKEIQILELGRQIQRLLKIKALNRKLGKSRNGFRHITYKHRALRKNTTSGMRREFEAMGFDMSNTKDAHFTQADKSHSSVVTKKKKPVKSDNIDSDNESKTTKRKRSVSRAERAPLAKRTKISRDVSGIRDAATLIKVKKSEQKQRKNIVKRGKGNTTESDRKIVEKKPKHLFSGKRGIGKTQRR